jgi:hypothetical protein
MEHFEMDVTVTWERRAPRVSPIVKIWGIFGEVGSRRFETRRPTFSSEPCNLDPSKPKLPETGRFGWRAAQGYAFPKAGDTRRKTSDENIFIRVRFCSRLSPGFQLGPI